MIRKNKTELIGCYELQATAHRDPRGIFIKTFEDKIYRKLELQTEFKEDYYTISKKNVIRGMHFQLPPYDHEKLVYCVQGAALDVVTDLRKGSPTFGKSIQRTLSAEQGNCIYIPKGFAHGFCALAAQTVMMYKTSTVHRPEADSGILWNSIGVKWPVTNPILSLRDTTFSPLDQFKSPFVFLSK